MGSEDAFSAWKVAPFPGAAYSRLSRFRTSRTSAVAHRDACGPLSYRDLKTCPCWDPPRKVCISNSFKNSHL